MIMSLKQKKIQFKAKIKLNNNMLAKQLASNPGKLSQGKNDVEAMWSPVP